MNQGAHLSGKMEHFDFPAAIADKK